MLRNQAHLGLNPELATHGITRGVITDLPNRVASTDLLRLLCRLNNTTHIKHLAPPYSELPMYQARGYYYPQPDLTERGGEIPSIACVPLPWQQMRPRCQFPEDLLGIIIRLFSWPVNSTSVGPFAWNQPQPKETRGEMGSCLAAESGESAGPLTCSWLWWVLAIFPFNFGTSPSMLCMLSLGGRVGRLPMWGHLSWWKCICNNTEAPWGQASRLWELRGRTNPFSMAMKSSPRSLLAVLGEEGEVKQGKPHALRVLFNICRLPDSPTWSARIRILLI